MKSTFNKIAFLWKVYSSLVWIGALVCGLSFSAAAQVMSGYSTNGSAVTYGDGLIRMTAAGESWVSASAWNTTQHSLKDTFELSVNMFFGCDNGPDGADGISFQMHTNAAGTAALGAGGGGMGMVGSNSLGVEFDTWNYNIGGDIADDHITIIQDGNPNSLGPNSAPYLAGPVAIAGGRDLEDCAENSNDYYTVTYRFIPGATTQTLEVYEEHAATPTLSYTGDIINDIFDGDTMVWWGFTASTGGGDNEQWVAPEGTIIPWQCTVNDCCAPYEVSATGPINICQGDTLDLNVVGTYEQYYWSNGDTTSVTKITEPGWYSVDVIQNQAGSLCPGSDSIEVVSTAVFGTLTGDNTICDDGSSTAPLTLEFSGGSGPYALNYTVDGLVQPAISGITSSPFVFNSNTGAGTYVATALEDATGCNGFVTGTPVINIFPGSPIAIDSSFCEGDSTLLAVVDEGGSYDWYVDQVGGVSFHNGTTYQTPQLIADTTYWVENTMILDSVRTIQSYADTTGGSGAFYASDYPDNNGLTLNRLEFTAHKDVTFDSVDVYSFSPGGTCGAITVRIHDLTLATFEDFTYTPSACQVGVNVNTVAIGHAMIEGHDYRILADADGGHYVLRYFGLVSAYPMSDYDQFTFTGASTADAWPGLFRFKTSYPYEGASCTRTPVRARAIPTPTITSVLDTIVCDEFVLPTITGTNLTGSESYFDGLGGTGTAYAAGDLISSDLTIYIYDSITTVGCADQDTFTIDIVASPELVNLSDTTVCDSLILPAITGTNLTGAESYFDAASGGGTAFAAGDVISSNATLFIYDSITTAPHCFDQDTFDVTVVESPELESLVDTTICDEFVLPTIAGTNLTGSESYFDGLGGTGTAYAAGDLISSDLTIYIYDSITTVGCADQDTFTIDIVASPELVNLSDTAVCDSLVLPAITGTNLTGAESYFDAASGGGTAFASGDVISSTTTLFIYDSITTAPHCFDQDTFDVVVIPRPQLIDVADTSSCEAYVLPIIQGNNLTGNESYFSGANGTGTVFNPGDVISTVTTLYIYDAVTTIQGCADEQSFVFSFSETPVTNAVSNPPTACQATDASIVFDNLSPNQVYSISYNTVPAFDRTSNASGEITLSNLSAGTYADIIIMLGQCSDTVATINISDPGSPSLLMPTDTAICLGDSYFLQAGNPDNAVITWSNTATNGSLILPTSSENLSASAVRNGCTTTGSFDLVVNSLPQATMSGGGSVCQGGTNAALITTTVTSGLSPYIIVYQDQLNGDISLTIDSVFSFSSTQSNTYVLQSVVDANQCVGQATGSASVDTIPVLHVAQLQTECNIIDQTFGLTMTIDGGIPPYTIAGMGFVETTTEQLYTLSPIATTGDVSNYLVNISDSSGCANAAYFAQLDGEIECLLPAIELPNSMTPNDDGFNDSFWITNIEYYPSNKLQIFNRWGDLVYKTDGYNNEWEGKRNGKLLPMGAYYYVLDLNDGSDVFTGYLMILE